MHGRLHGDRLEGAKMNTHVPQEPAVAFLDGTGLGVGAGAIWEPAESDVLAGRGAAVNAQPGNQRFRALCAARKAEFDAANPAARWRIAAEIVAAARALWGCRFLRREHPAAPWVEVGEEAAQLKAQQILRDYRRPDRVERELNTKKRSRSTATPVFLDALTGAPPVLPLEPIVEVADGAHAHDVLLGRGAFVAAHLGNERLRRLAMERKSQFEKGSFTEKRTLACEIVQKIRELDPPGRFLRKVPRQTTNGTFHSEWEEVGDETAISKACQTMRDINRPDREHRRHRKRLRELKLQGQQEQPPAPQGPSLPTEGHDGTSHPSDVFRNHYRHVQMESHEDIFRNGLIVEALENALESVPIPPMHGHHA